VKTESDSWVIFDLDHDRRRQPVAASLELQFNHKEYVTVLTTTDPATHLAVLVHFSGGG
jgi:hypothetical protein